MHSPDCCIYISLAVYTCTFSCRKSGDTLSKEFDKNRDEFARSFSDDRSLDDVEPYVELGEEENPVNYVPTDPLSPIGESDEDERRASPSEAQTKVTCMYMYM